MTQGPTSLPALDGIAICVQDLVLLLDQLLRIPTSRLDKDVEGHRPARRLCVVEAVQDVVCRGALSADGAGEVVEDGARGRFDLFLGRHLGAHAAGGDLLYPTRGAGILVDVALVLVVQAESVRGLVRARPQTARMTEKLTGCSASQEAEP